MAGSAGRVARSRTQTPSSALSNLADNPVGFGASKRITGACGLGSLDRMLVLVFILMWVFFWSRSTERDSAFPQSVLSHVGSDDPPNGGRGFWLYRPVQALPRFPIIGYFLTTDLNYDRCFHENSRKVSNLLVPAVSPKAGRRGRRLTQQRFSSTRCSRRAECASRAPVRGRYPIA